MTLADQIIDHGPYAAGDLSPVAYGVDSAALNQLRAELIAGRQARRLDGATPAAEPGKALLPYRYWDGITGTEIWADAYPYGGDRPVAGVQLTLQQDDQTIAVRLPGPSARLLAQAVLSEVGP